jgi:hypothetical protein
VALAIGRRAFRDGRYRPCGRPIACVGMACDLDRGNRWRPSRPRPSRETTNAPERARGNRRRR